MPLLLHVDTDGLEHAAHDLDDAAGYTARAAQTPLGDALYRGTTTGPQSVQAALRLIQQRTEEAHAAASCLAGETGHLAATLLTCAGGFSRAEELCTVDGR